MSFEAEEGLDFERKEPLQDRAAIKIMEGVIYTASLVGTSVSAANKVAEGVINVASLVSNGVSAANKVAEVELDNIKFSNENDLHDVEAKLDALETDNDFVYVTDEESLEANMAMLEIKDVIVISSLKIKEGHFTGIELP